MTSIRELIARDVEETLIGHKSSSIQLKKTFRAPKDISDIPRTAFPLAIITSGDEEREDITMGGSAITRQGIISYLIDLHVWGDRQDQEMNELIDMVETALDLDRTRSSNALDTRVVQVTLLDPTSAAPWTSCRVTAEVEYCFIRGNS